MLTSALFGLLPLLAGVMGAPLEKVKRDNDYYSK